MAAKKIINTATGEIELSPGFSVSRNSRVQHLVEALGAENFETIDLHADGAHCKIWNVELEGHYFLFDFYFKKEQLHFITFILNDKPIAAGNWDNWSKKEELAKKKYFDKWLTTQTGGYRKFNWGLIGACYDERAGGSYIFLNYNP